MSGPVDRSEYDGTGTGHAPYGAPAYRGRGQAGDEVAARMSGELEEEFGSDDPGRGHLSDRMLRADERGGAVPRLVEDDAHAADAVADDVLAECTTEGLDDRHELSAEEAAMHYVDELDDRIPE